MMQALFRRRTRRPAHRPQTARTLAAKLIVAWLAVFVSSNLPSPTSATEVQLPFVAAAGDTFAIQLRHEREHFKNGSRETRIVSTTPVTAEILEALPDGWVFAWSFGTPVFEEGDETVAPAVRALTGIVAGLRLEFETDAAGKPLGIRNMTEVRRHLRQFSARFVTGLVGVARREGASSAELVQLRSSLREQAMPYVRMTNDQVNATFLADPRMLNRVTGNSYSTETAVEVEDQIVDPLSGSTIPALNRSRLREVDEQNQIAVIEWSQDLDPEVVTTNLGAVMPGLGEEVAAEDLSGAEVSVDSTALYLVSLLTGQVQSMNAERVVEFAKERLIDRRIFTQGRSR